MKQSGNSDMSLMKYNMSGSCDAMSSSHDDMGYAIVA